MASSRRSGLDIYVYPDLDRIGKRMLVDRSLTDKERPHSPIYLFMAVEEILDHCSPGYLVPDKSGLAKVLRAHPPNL